jgi:hypothetical protein
MFRLRSSYFPLDFPAFDFDFVSVYVDLLAEILREKEYDDVFDQTNRICLSIKRKVSENSKNFKLKTRETYLSAYT